MRKALGVVLALAVLACSSSETIAPKLPNDASLEFVGQAAQPETPTPLSAILNAGQIELTFTDNTTATDEYATCARFTDVNDAPVTTQCLFAIDYDVPNGSTGTRSGSVIAALGAFYVRLQTWRHFQQPDSWWADVASLESDRIAVTNAVPLSTRKKGGRK